MSVSAGLIEIMLASLLALLFGIGITILEIKLAGCKSKMAGLWPIIIIMVLVSFSFGYVHYVTSENSGETVRYDMDYGNYATMTLLRDESGNITQFSDVKVYNSKDVQVDEIYVCLDEPELDLELSSTVKYFVDKYELSGSSTEMDDIKNPIYFGSLTLSRTSWIALFFSYLVPLLMIYVTARLIKSYRFRRDEMQKLKIVEI